MITIALLLVGAEQTLYWNGPRSFSHRGPAKGHFVEITIRQANFASRGRRVFWVCGGRPVTGKLPASAERPITACMGSTAKPRDFIVGEVPPGDAVGLTAAQWLTREHTQISSFTVRVDGKLWAVPTRLYDDLLNPNLDSAHFSCVLASGGKTLRIRQSFGDAGTGFHADFAITASGSVSRAINGY